MPAQTEKVLRFGTAEQLPGQLLERSQFQAPWIDRNVDPQALVSPPKASETGVEQTGDFISEQRPKELLPRIEGRCLRGRESNDHVPDLARPLWPRLGLCPERLTDPGDLKRSLPLALR